MLTITIPASIGDEYWDEINEKFIDVNPTKEQTLQLEHSLVSLSKWESKWCKPFISNKSKTKEEIIDYVRCMVCNKNFDEESLKHLTDVNIQEINKYIDAPMTATWFSEDKNSKPNREVITSELIYYWMIAFNIPFECQKWHLNRLLTLIKVCSIKNQPTKKMGTNELLSRNRALNEARRKQLNSKG